MKIHLEIDESMRMFVVDDVKEGHYWCPEVDIPEELLERFQKAEKEFRDVDEELYKLYKTAQKKYDS